MLKETSYQEKIEMLSPWLNEIVEVIKKDLKNEHLKLDRQFCKKYFLGKNPSQVQVQEMASAYRTDIASGNVGLGEFIATRWLLKNAEIYGHFEQKIKNFTEDFEALTELPLEIANSLLHSSVQQFGAKKTYLFSVFNSVVFPAEIYAQLRAMAEKETQTILETEEAKNKTENLENLQKRHQKEMTLLAEKYEKKLQGLQKKYLADMAACKKQISQLQKKIAGHES